MDNSKNLNIIALDAMGGDYGPEVTVPAAVEATEKKDLAVILVGEKKLIDRELSKFSPLETSLLSVVPAQGVVTENDSPALAYRTKPRASVYVAAGIVKAGKASGFVSMGSTGASIAASTVLYGTMDGIERGAIGGPVIGYSPRTVIVDLGTNVDTRPEQLLDFGALGSIMSRVIYKEKNPKIALLSVGKEKGKGSSLVKETSVLLENSGLNFVGNIEPDDLLKNEFEVVLCDGFVGNIILKLTESLGKIICSQINEILGETDISKTLTASIFEKTNTLESFGGGPLLGVKGVAIVGHGASGIKAIVNAINTANFVIDVDFIEEQINELLRVHKRIT
ncbi:MAG: phosphate acyltransferase PlsX [Dehalococcoidia bacterium]|jgi:glycerol-3-phosphate acyltransferase PlsX|nr:phosphate acyltransferase PlsX [Dehalococcoidia bacterium]